MREDQQKAQNLRGGKAILGEFLEDLASGQTSVVQSLDGTAVLGPGGLGDAAGIARRGIGRVFGNEIELRHGKR